jgi:mannose-1-phosphate guanylyltransferase
MSLLVKQHRRLALVMAGGRGTRFWPRSRERCPKQFLAITGKESLLQQTVHRLGEYFQPDDIFILTTKQLAEETMRLLPAIPRDNILIEPEGRNTAPCLALALVMIEQLISDGVMVVLSADAWIGDEAKFLTDIETAILHAIENHNLVTLGICPNYPETGYGYIETEEGTKESKLFNVKSFKEKPSHEKATEYLKAGNYYWNAGIFIWTLSDFRAQLLEHCPEVIKPLDDWVASGAISTKLLELYHNLPKISIDYALMERTKKLVVLPASFRWSDVGSWSAMAGFYEADSSNNVTVGDVLTNNSHNCAIFGGQRFIVVNGLSDLIVVDELDALLICHKDSTQDIKSIVDEIKLLGRNDLL